MLVYTSQPGTTGHNAANEFAATFDPPRRAKMQHDSRQFQLYGGLATYEIRSAKTLTGWVWEIHKLPAGWKPENKPAKVLTLIPGEFKTPSLRGQKTMLDD